MLQLLISTSSLRDSFVLVATSEQLRGRKLRGNSRLSFKRNPVAPRMRLEEREQFSTHIKIICHLLPRANFERDPYQSHYFPTFLRRNERTNTRRRSGTRSGHSAAQKLEAETLRTSKTLRSEPEWIFSGRRRMDTRESELPTPDFVTDSSAIDSILRTSDSKGGSVVTSAKRRRDTRMRSDEMMLLHITLQQSGRTKITSKSDYSGKEQLSKFVGALAHSFFLLFESRA